jgi:hypothetical protein
MASASHSAANGSGSSAACVHDCINLSMLRNAEKDGVDLKVL